MSDCEGAVRRAAERGAAAFLGAIWGVRVTGLESVPRSGPLIVACNHASLVDPPLLGSTIAAARSPGFLAKKELFDVPGLAWFMRSAGVIPLDRGSADHSAMRAAIELLEGGGSLIIFPEGTRVKKGQSRPPKLGVSFLAAKTGAPVVPARVAGTADFPRAFPLEVRFGAPLPAPPEGREAASAFARTVMDRIYAL